MKSQSLAVYEKTVKLTDNIGNKVTRAKRLDDLIKPPEDNETIDWYMCVPTCFNGALDIKKTSRVKNGKETMVWTQGSAFSFKVGDTLYNTPKAYLDWQKALKHISLCISVENASDAIPARKSMDQNENISRDPGSVQFSMLTPNENRSAVVKRGSFHLTQDEFVLYLINGSTDEVESKIQWK